MFGSRGTALAVIGLVSALVALPGCQESGSSAKLGFKGRAMTSKNQPLNNFTLSVARSPSTAKPQSTTVTAKNGQYETFVPIEAPAVAGSKTLGSRNESVMIQVSASGYKTKTFKVTADQVLVSEPNTLNVTLEPAQ